METTTNTLTTAATSVAVLKSKVNNLLALKKINPEDVSTLNPIEREHFIETATETLSDLRGEERDRFLDKIEPIIPQSMKNNVWELNHFLITDAIANFMRKHGIMPTKNMVAQETGLSRQTVAKHFAAYSQHPQFIAEKEQFKFMTSKLLATVFKYANNGDMRAARLYFEMVGVLNKNQPNTIVNGQTNYIQIKNTILSQENLKQLSEEQLDRIEKIITKGEVV